MPTATEPAFLGERRQKAQLLTTTLSMPSKTQEDWRRTSLEGVDLDSYKATAITATFKGKVPAGVIFTDILTAAAEHPELVSKYLGTLYKMDQNKFSANQAAYLNGGTFVYVPKNVVVEEPLLVEYTAADGAAHYLHTLVVADTNSSVTVLERFVGEGDYLVVSVTEAFPLAGANLKVGYLQNNSEDALAFMFRRGKPGRDATLDWAGGEFGSALLRSEILNEMAGVGSQSKIKLVFGATGNQHMDLVAYQSHTGENSYSDILGRGVLSGKAHSVFRGTGEILAKALGAATYQKQQALVLSQTARADSIPALIIDEHNVAGAGHASTVGQLDEESLFYLMSRGLSRQQAILMMVLAFLGPVLELIPVEELREEMTRLMGEKVTA